MTFNRMGPPGLPPPKPEFPWGSLVPPLVISVLFASGAAWWLFNGLFLVLFVVPLVVVPIFQWYLSNNLVEGTCPQCGAPVQGLKGQRTQCFQCGTAMSGEIQNGVFLREGAAATESGVVEVEVEVD